MVLQTQLDQGHLTLVTLVAAIIAGAGIYAARKTCRAFLVGCLVLVCTTTGLGVSILFMVAEAVHQREQANEAIVDALRAGDIEVLRTQSNSRYTSVHVRQGQKKVRECFLFPRAHNKPVFHCPARWNWNLEKNSLILVNGRGK